MNGPLETAVDRAQVLICVGPGGVGKTTVAAALALGGALSKRTSLVCTIDPAKRLANALGVSSLGNGETRIAKAELARAQLPPDAPLHATMLDMKQSWDALIERLAPTEVRERILQNRFYRSLSSALAGSQEYIAMDRLSELRQRRAYDLIVLDTPPSGHAVDFFDAPTRVLDFLDSDAVRWLLGPALAAGKIGLKLVNLGGRYAAKTLAKLTGAETLAELAGFLSSMSGMNADFRERAERVRSLLREPTTQFILVAAPSSDSLDEVARFQSALQERQLRLAAVVLNRINVAPAPAQREAARALDPPLRAKVEATLDEAGAMAMQDAEALAQLKRRFGPIPVVPLPRLESDVHDLVGLKQIAHLLLGQDPREPAGPGPG